jgi:hypothetical protein
MTPTIVADSLHRWRCASREDESTTVATVPHRSRSEGGCGCSERSRDDVGRSVTLKHILLNLLLNFQLSAMGKKLSETEKNKKSWDSNAITPGTPFMELLATSLRYWVVKKMNSDPGWKQVRVMMFVCILYADIPTDRSDHF